MSQSLKAFSPSFVDLVLSNPSTDVRAEQDSNALFPISKRDEGRATRLRLVQLENALFPILDIFVEERSRVESFVPANTYSPISVKEVGKAKVVRLEQFWNILFGTFEIFVFSKLVASASEEQSLNNSIPTLVKDEEKRNFAREVAPAKA